MGAKAEPRMGAREEQTRLLEEQSNSTKNIVLYIYASHYIKIC